MATSAGLSPLGKPLFTRDEDRLLIYLKEQKNLTWRKIACFFNGRTRGTLQVRYSRKLHKRSRDRSAEKSSFESLEAQVEKLLDQIPGQEEELVEVQPVEHTEKLTLEPEKEKRTADEHTSVEQVTPIVMTRLRPVRSTPREAPEPEAEPREEIATEEVPKQGRKHRKSSTGKRRSVLKPGWHAIHPLISSGSHKHLQSPNVFFNPPNTHLVEYNSRSGSYRIRRRREDEVDVQLNILSSNTSADENGNCRASKRRKVNDRHGKSKEQARDVDIHDTIQVQPAASKPLPGALYSQVIPDSDDESDLTILDDTIEVGSNKSADARELDLGTEEKA